MEKSMSNDLISRNALLADYSCKCGGECATCRYETDTGDCRVLLDAPAVDAEPVRHGRWVQSTKEDEDWGGFFYRYTCTVCGWNCGSNPNGLYVFCPGCGAKMDAEVEE